MANFTGVVYLTEAQFNTLKTNGTITVDGITLNYDENTLYVTPDNGGSGSGVSQEEFNKLLNNTTIIMPNANESVLLGSSNAAALTATQSVIVGKNAKAVNKGVAIGYNAMTTEANGGVAIGDYAETKNGVAIGTEAESLLLGVAIGNNASSSIIGGISIGDNSTTSAVNSIQLGAGTNSTQNTLQVYTDNIYNHNTHTLTVQNVSLNGNDLQGTLSSLEGQNEYIGRYILSSYTADTIQTALSNYVNVAAARTPRNGDLVNIVNAGTDVDYSGQQWIYSDGIWKYYIDFENHNVINNLNSTSTTDGLSAMQGKVLNDRVNTLSSNFDNYLPLSAGSDKKLTGSLYTSNDVIIDNAKAYKSKNSVGETKNLLNISASDNVVLNADNLGRVVIGGSAISPTSANHKRMNLGIESTYFNNIYGTRIYQDGKQVANKEDIPTFSYDATTKTLTITT